MRSLLRVAPLALLAAAPPLAAQRPRRPQPLDTLHISTGSRVPGAGAAFRSVEVLDRAALARLPARTLADAIGRALGVDVLPRSPVSADLSIRGSSFEQVVVLVDGVRVSDAQTGHFDLDLAVPLAQVERIEVLRGAGSALYGPDAVGGVVNVVTRRDDAPRPGAADAARETHGSVQGGSFGTAAASLAIDGRGGARRASLGADYQRSDGHRADTDYEMLQLRLASARDTRHGTLRTDLAVARRDFGAGDFYGAYPSVERTTSATGALRWAAAAHGAWQVTTGASARRHGDRFTLYRDDPSVYQNHHVSWDGAADVVARRAARAGAPAIALGAEARRLWLASARLGDRQETRAAAFAEATLGGTARAGANAGLRADWSSEFGAVLAPSLAGRLALGPAWALRASAHRGWRAPTWTERYYEDPANVGDPALRPERFWAGEVGLRGAPTRRLRLDAALFIRRATDLIDWARPTGASADEAWRTRNVERATFTGVELRADVARALGLDWTLRASTLDVRAAAASGYVGKYALRPVTRAASLAAVLPLGPGTLAVDAGWAGHAGEDPFFRADARLAVPWRGLELTLDGENLSGADYLDASAKRVAGRALYVGVRW
ncbi:MAG TPA: TonB-dependent receptor [Gemmatimonadaceae bacterium]|nr:TonB-dependent receptor [Gemmatimonadaceae bacterium]